MIGRALGVAAVGVLAWLGWPSDARAGDLLRLNGGTDAPTLTLGFDGYADTELVHRRYGYGFRGYGYGVGYRGFYGGYRGFYGGYGGFYRGYGHYPRVAVNVGFYSRPYYNYYPRYYGYNGFARAYYYSAPAYYAAPIYYAPPVYYYNGYCSLNGPPSAMPYATVLGAAPANGQYYSVPAEGYSTPGYASPGAPAANQTYPYDGGPQAPVPMPREEPAPLKVPRPVVPVEGRFVSLTAEQPAAQPAAPAQPSRFAYPAYGEDNRASGFATDRLATKNGR